jgi:uncharacterized OB-fold protein
MPNATTDTAPAPPLPEPDELTDFFWDGANRHELWLQRCEKCGTYQHRPRPVCKKCDSFDLAPSQVSGRGVIYSFTVGTQAFHPWFVDRLPYVMAVVELEEQAHLKILTNIVGCAPDDVEVGMAVEVTFQELSDDITLPVFGPTTTTEGAH